MYVALSDAEDVPAESWGPGDHVITSTPEMGAFPRRSSKITCVTAVVFILISQRSREDELLYKVKMKILYYFTF